MSGAGPIDVAHPGAAPPVLDAATLGMLAALVPENPAFVSTLLDTFLHDAGVHVTALHAVLRAPPPASDHVRHTAHALKSGASTVGALALAAACLGLERAVRDNRPLSALAEGVAAVEGELARVALARAARMVETPGGEGPFAAR